MELIDMEFLLKVIKEAEDESLKRLSSIFRSQLAREDNFYNKKQLELVSLFYDVSSMILNPKSANEPFQAFMQWEDGSRSAIPEDLTSEQLTTLSDVLESIEHSSLKSRVADLLWVCCKLKDPSHAKTAIDFYIKNGIKPDTWRSAGSNKEFERAYRLARQLKNNERLSIIDKLFISAFLKDDEDYLKLTYSVAELIENLNALKDHNLMIAQRLEVLGLQLKSEGQYQEAIRYLQLSAKKYQKEPNDPKYVATLFYVAESYALHAESHFNKGVGAKLISSALFETAIKAYRKIPTQYRNEYSVDQKISILRDKLNEAGKHTLEHMGVVQTQIEDAEKLKELAKKHVTRKASEYEALVYFAGICHVDNYDVLIEREKNNLNKNLFSSLFGSTQYSSDGRVIAKTPSLGLEADEESVNSVVYDNMVRTFARNIQFKVKMAIIPALHQILAEHTFTKNFVFEMCDYSPLIPKSSIHLISQALWLGLECEFSTAIHIVAPQVEKIVREQLKLVGAQTTTLDDKSGIENEKGLSSLLDMPEALSLFGQDQHFELKALFTHPIGPNLRNEVAHGLLTDSSGYSEAPIYAWWVLMRMTINSIISASGD